MKSRVLAVDILAAIFGIGSWVCLIGVFVELPLFVQNLPEGWALPSYLSVVVQLANIGPIIYWICNRYFPSTVTDKRTIYVTLCAGCVTTLLLAYFWSYTTYVFGANRSTALIGKPDIYSAKILHKYMNACIYYI